MIAIIDYGVGNLFSLKSSLAAIGREAVVTGDRAVLRAASHVILPGVGAFGDAAARLRAAGMAEAVLEAAAAGKPVLGICLGMQLLLERSFEYGEHPGLGLIPGEVRPIRDVIPAGLAVPHMGWNALRFPAERPRSPIFAALEEGEHVYFVHSYARLCLRRGAHRLDRVRRASRRRRCREETCTAPSSTRRRAGMWDCGFSRHSADWRVKHDSASGDPSL